MPISHVETDQNEDTKQRLLFAVAAGLQLPLIQIARRAELGKITNEADSALTAIEGIADHAHRFIDNYLLSLELAQGITLEPVAISAVLNDTAHQLSSFGQEYNCDIELHMSGRYEPVLVHRRGLQAALLSLGSLFIENQASTAEKRSVVKLGSHRSRGGIVAGLFAKSEIPLTNQMLRRGRTLLGNVKQPLPHFAANGGAVYLAEALLTHMSSGLRVAQHQKLTGLAATLMPAGQLSLI